MNKQVLADQMPARYQSEWLTAREAAQHLRVAHRTILDWAKTGKIPAHRLSGTWRCTWRFRADELDAFMNGERIGGNKLSDVLPLSGDAVPARSCNFTPKKPCATIGSSSAASAEMGN